MKAALVPAERIEHAILIVRGQKVMLDADLAALYGVETRVLVQAVKRNPERFPRGLHVSDDPSRACDMEITDCDVQSRSQDGTAPAALRLHRARGADGRCRAQLAARRREMSLYVVRAFVRMREVLATHKALAKKLADLEKKTGALALKHDRLALATRKQFREVIAALHALMTPPEPKRRPIGFMVPDEK